MTFTTDELRTVRILQGLPEPELAWFGDHGDKINLAQGDRMFERGQPADFMFIVVRGTIQRYEEIGGEWLVVATTRQGDVTGMLPYSRMTSYPGYTIATEPAQVLRVREGAFPEMLRVSPEIGRRLVAVMADRVRGDVRLEQQRERMVALARLSAGLAHELNNPAAAVRRAAAALSQQLATMASLGLELLRHDADDATIQAIRGLCRAGHDRASPDLTSLERSSREEALTAWLEDHGIAHAGEIAGAFVDSGVFIDVLEPFAQDVPAPVLATALAWSGCELAADRLTGEIGSSAARISDLITSVKAYSQMDRSPEHKPTDVREGLDDTLMMLSHRLTQKQVRLVRDYQDDLPVIPANAGELNQVWTNLIDNALDAVNDGGELHIQARQDDAWVAVRVIDTGRGIPDEMQARIFEPFFTTKAVGEGTGLGLDIALRIVKTHQGHIEVQSRPGKTELCVRLPRSPTGLSRRSQRQRGGDSDKAPGR